MTTEQRTQLLNLHTTALTLWAKATKTNRGWQEAFDADDAYRAALFAIEVTE